jgi:phage gp36-like protein
MSNPLTLSLHDIATESASGFGTPQDISAYRSAGYVLVNVTALTGTSGPSVAVHVESAPSPSGAWKQASPDQTIAVPAFVRFSVMDLERYARVAFALSGTAPTATFSASLEAHTTYADLADLGRLGIPLSELHRIDDLTKIGALISATDLCDSYLRRAASITTITLPLLSWGNELRRAASVIAAYDCAGIRGYQPNGVNDDLRKRYEDVLAWLAAVADGKADAGGVPVNPVPSAITQEGRAHVSSRASRGWVDTDRTIP